MQNHQESPPGPDYDTSAPVLVTGATVYIAGWLTWRLLERGFTVHAAVRNPGLANQMAHVERMRRELPGTIQFFQADLLERGSYTRAMKGCGVVFHTASPLELVVRDPQRELIDPAVLGTHSVLESVNITDSVRRVVLTSSMVATYGDNADLGTLPGGKVNEEAWNTSSSPRHQPYAYSKTQAERTAWKLAEAQDRWQLVTINPGLVLGPCVSERVPEAFSFSVMKKFADGSMKTGAPPYELGVVDVRDVAEAHLRAAFIAGGEGPLSDVFRGENLHGRGTDPQAALWQRLPVPAPGAAEMAGVAGRSPGGQGLHPQGRAQEHGPPVARRQFQVQAIARHAVPRHRGHRHRHVLADDRTGSGVSDRDPGWPSRT